MKTTTGQYTGSDVGKRSATGPEAEDPGSRPEPGFHPTGASCQHVPLLRNFTRPRNSTRRPVDACTGWQNVSGRPTIRVRAYVQVPGQDAAVSCHFSPQGSQCGACFLSASRNYCTPVTFDTPLNTSTALVNSSPLASSPRPSCHAGHPMTKYS
ncbi:uncharacterized protein [Dermacentor albipictus]|uniref:uncharacterized protein n=1 Tax=Dermacentor albipictus TaxID=60249 RepID=UPI0038FD292E